MTRSSKDMKHMINQHRGSMLEDVPDIEGAFASKTRIGGSVAYADEFAGVGNEANMKKFKALSMQDKSTIE